MLGELFSKELEHHRLDGCFGVSPYKEVYDNLMPVQREKLKQISGKQFKELIEKGSFITIAFAYPSEAVKSIAVKTMNGYDLDKWNYYSEWYQKLNQALNESSSRLAESLNSISIPATLGGIAEGVDHVEHYFPLTVSHRVGAELSGVGWRGKNELVINPKYSCAIRFASVIAPETLERSNSLEMDCGSCNACLQACSFLKNKDKLGNFREQCRKYINALGLNEEVCGKCIKACVYQSVYSHNFTLK